MSFPTSARKFAAPMVVLVVLSLLIAPITGISPARAADNGQYGISPTRPPNAAPNQLPRPYFEPALTPGTTVSDSITVNNSTANPLTFTLYSSDAFNPDSGGFSLRPHFQAMTDIGLWIHLSADKVTVPAHRSIDVPFAIAVPNDAQPGDHVGGIVAESTAADFSQGGDLGVGVVQAVGTRIYCRVDGPVQPGLAITELKIEAPTSFGTLFGGSVNAIVSFTVTNTGNVRLTPAASGKLIPLIGRSSPLAEVAIPELLPRGSARVTYPVTSVRPLGKVTASITVGAADYQVSGSQSKWLMPWLLLALVLLVFLLAFVVFRRRRARRRGLVDDSSGSSSQDGRPKPGATKKRTAGQESNEIVEA